MRKTHRLQILSSTFLLKKQNHGIKFLFALLHFACLSLHISALAGSPFYMLRTCPLILLCCHEPRHLSPSPCYNADAEAHRAPEIQPPKWCDWISTNWFVWIQWYAEQRLSFPMISIVNRQKKMVCFSKQSALKQQVCFISCTASMVCVIYYNYNGDSLVILSYDIVYELSF